MKNAIIVATLTTALAFGPNPVFAQSAPQFGNVVSGCGTTNGATYVPNTNRPTTLDTTGRACSDVNATISGTVTANQGTAGATPWPVTINTPLSATTNTTATITTGSTFQVLANSNTSRKSLDIQNICNKSGNCTTQANFCYLYIAASGSGTTGNSIILAPGQEYLRSSGAVPPDTISGTCDGTADKIYVAVQ